MISVYEDTDFVKLHVWPIDKDYISTNIFLVNVLLKVYRPTPNRTPLPLNSPELVNHHEIYSSNDQKSKITYTSYSIFYGTISNLLSFLIGCLLLLAYRFLLVTATCTLSLVNGC